MGHLSDASIRELQSYPIRDKISDAQEHKPIRVIVQSDRTKAWGLAFQLRPQTEALSTRELLIRQDYAPLQMHKR